MRRVTYMRITVAMEYGIATILYVGQESTSSRSGKTRYVTIEEISRACGISRNHLNKVVYLLGQSGLLHTFRGRNGGMTLGKPLSAISLGEVIQLFQTEWHWSEVGSFQRRIQSLLQVPLQEAQHSSYLVLNQISFADLLKQM
ncbi:RrF2 family transcriptional regulator [Exiguobacterium acetylicum]|uniref:RrF2 family transcriptional regulator n=2 Tax=Exiguobacterium TaxID=33986 RepID=UPI002930AE2C|nr:Rrf2 family transcriptional regulator [Exiguobacterium acetylicum]